MLDDLCREGEKIQNPCGNTSRRSLFTVLTLPDSPAIPAEGFQHRRHTMNNEPNDWDGLTEEKKSSADASGDHPRA